jgi:hypothetical protein
MMMVAQVSAASAPTASFTPGGIAAIGEAQVVVSAIDSNSSALLPAFSIGVTLATSANVPEPPPSPQIPADTFATLD